uniref:Ultraviolet-B receptor UVR8 n=3 Tax=Oryza TaxID=4527 RepID=A0A0D3EW74_9ORYZ
MNGRGGGGGGGVGVVGAGGEEQMEMEEDGAGLRARVAAGRKERVVLMWGYLPGVSPQRSPLLGPVPVRLPAAAGGDGWRDVCGGGCGFAMAISESGKLLTWGSADDMGQSYVTAGKHEETPEAFPLPSDVAIVRADAGWAHCVAITDEGDVYTWGWKECVPTGRVISDQSSGGTLEKDERQSAIAADQGNSITVSPRSQVSRTSSGAASGPSESRGTDDSTKRRRLSSTKHAPESSTSSDENLSAPPCVVTFNTGVKIMAVAAGGRHTLALSDLGQVWGWGYGGEGQLGLGSRIRTVSSPHPIPCIESALYSKDRPAAMKGNKSAEAQISKVMGNCVKAIACGGRHSAVVTDSGALLTFGWGLYGQCGQGNTDDVLSPTCVSSILGVKMQDIGAGLWHTTVPKLVDASSLENKNARAVSCGARHSAIITDEGEVFCWGWNKYGQLGLGDSMDRNVPCSVPVDAYHPLNVSCGWWHTLVLAESPT